MMDVSELPVVVQALMAASFLFGVLVGIGITGAAISGAVLSHRSGGVK
jgi:hypothetical protein